MSWSRPISLLAMLTVLGAALVPTGSAAAEDKQVARGKYLVTLGGCNDCHTPGYFLGKPDMTRFLGGSDVGFAIPKVGVFVPPNLTPDAETGLGTWSKEQIVAAITKGKRPDGRELAPIMPWRALAHLTPSDAQAIAAYLKTLITNTSTCSVGPNGRWTACFTGGSVLR